MGILFRLLTVKPLVGVEVERSYCDRVMRLLGKSVRVVALAVTDGKVDPSAVVSGGWVGGEAWLREIRGVDCTRALPTREIGGTISLPLFIPDWEEMVMVWRVMFLP
jgi:hypothetical protein